MSVTLDSKSTCRKGYSFKLCVDPKGEKNQSFCVLNGWVCCFSISDQPDAQQMRWHCLTGVSLHFKGSKMKRILLSMTNLLFGSTDLQILFFKL